MLNKSLACATLVLCSTAAFAAPDWSDTLTTDRPDAAEASVTVGKRRFQVESSVAYTRDTDAGVTTTAYAFPTLLRYGIVDPLELRMEAEIFTFSNDGTGSDRGRNDLDIGLKGHFCDQQGARPSFGTLAHLTLPVGNDAYSTNGFEPSAKILADWELPAGFSLGTNLGMDLPVRDAAGDKFARALYAAAFGHAIPGTKDRLRLFIEAAGAVPLKSGKDSEHTFDSGLAWLATPNLQFDVAAQVGLNDAAANLSGGLGVSWRY